MKHIAFSLIGMVALTACNITPQQGLQGMASMMVHGDYIRQSKRLCAQQNDPALGFQCEQQAQKEFQKFQNEQRKNSNE